MIWGLPLSMWLVIVCLTVAAVSFVTWIGFIGENIYRIRLALEKLAGTEETKPDFKEPFFYSMRARPKHNRRNKE